MQVKLLTHTNLGEAIAAIDNMVLDLQSTRDLIDSVNTKDSVIRNVGLKKLDRTISALIELKGERDER